MVQIGKSMNIHTIALFLPFTEPAWFHPMAGWKEEGQSPSLVGFGSYFERKGPFEELILKVHPLMPNTFSLLSSSLAVLLLPGNGCARISKETSVSRYSLLKSGALS